MRKKHYEIEEIMEKYEKLPVDQKNKILNNAIELVITKRAGTKEYAIATSMGYVYQDDGSYTK